MRLATHLQKLQLCYGVCCIYMRGIQEKRSEQRRLLQLFFQNAVCKTIRNDYGFVVVQSKERLQTLLTDFSSCPINLSQESPSRTNDHLEDRASGLSQQVFKAFGFYTWKRDSKTPPTFCLVIKTRLKSILMENASQA